MNKARTDKAKLIESKATLIGAVCGVPFYEHPVFGDDCPLLYITKCGMVRLSDYWELPDAMEYAECAPVNAFYE